MTLVLSFTLFENSYFAILFSIFVGVSVQYSAVQFTVIGSNFW